MKIYDKTTQTYKELVLKPGGDTLPIGGIIAFDSDTIPNGWLLCDGRAVSRTEYAELFKAIGTKHGSGDGSTTFNLPNPKGRTLVGKDSTDTNFNELGKTGGEKTHILTVDEMPSHTHNASTKANWTGSSSTWAELARAPATSGDIEEKDGYISAKGGGQPHNNLQPYIVTNYIIKAKNTAVVKGDVIQETDTASETNVYSAAAVDNKLKDIYSTEEVKTNKIWINGKPIYRKIFKFIADSHNYIYTHNTPNVEFITNVYGMTSGYPIPYSSITDTYIIEIWTEPTRFGIKSGTSINLDRTYYITLEYTKTTD